MTTMLTPQEQYRIYGVVLRHLSPIQKGIQFNHAVVALGFEYGIKTLGLNMHEPYSSVLLQCNTGVDLQEIIDMLQETDIKVSCFREPDLFDLTTAVAFQVPMREKLYWEPSNVSLRISEGEPYEETPEIWTVLNDLKLAY